MAHANPPGVSFLQLEACLCVWEHLLEAPREGDFQAYWEARGSVTMRLTVTPAIADRVLAIFDAGRTLDADFWDGWSYDWEVVPAIVADCGIDWTAPGQEAEGIPTGGTPEELVAIAKRARAACVRAGRFDSWMDSARVSASMLWGYREFPDDNPEGARAAFDEGEDAGAYIKREGERLNLTPREEWERGW